MNGDRGSWQLAEDTAKAFRVDVYEMVRGELPHAAASKATPLGTPNYRAAREQAGDLVSPVARRRVLKAERVGDFDPPVGWWAQRLAAEETIVRLERDLDRLRSVPRKGDGPAPGHASGHASGLSRNGSKPPGNAGCIFSGIAIACALGFVGYCYHAWNDTGDRMEREAIQERTAAETRYAKAVTDLRTKPPVVLLDIVNVAGDPLTCRPGGNPGRTECRWAFSPTAHHLYSWTEGSKLGSRVVGFRPEP